MLGKLYNDIISNKYHKNIPAFFLTDLIHYSQNSHYQLLMIRSLPDKKKCENDVVWCDLVLCDVIWCCVVVWWGVM